MIPAIPSSEQQVGLVLPPVAHSARTAGYLVTAGSPKRCSLILLPLQLSGAYRVMSCAAANVSPPQSRFCDDDGKEMDATAGSTTHDALNTSQTQTLVNLLDSKEQLKRVALTDHQSVFLRTH